MCRARSAPDSVRPNDQAEATRVGKRKWDFAPESGIVTIKLAQGSRKAKESGGNKLSRICGERFDGMNIALYILVERIRCDECQAVKQRGEGKWSNYGPQGNDQLGFDIVQPDENNWRRSAGGQGSLNPKTGEVRPGFPSLVSDGNECWSEHRDFRVELPEGRNICASVAINQSNNPRRQDRSPGFAFAGNSRSIDWQRARAVPAFGDG